jgi:Predicted membrane protein (DUF2306).
MMFLPVHVVAGATAIVAGFVALYARKGARVHRGSGTVFVYAMLTMSLSGAAIAVGRPGVVLNVPAGLLTAYLVITAFLTVRPSSRTSRQVERAAMVAAFGLGGASIIAALVNAGRGNMGFAFPLVMFGVLALAAGVGDRRMFRAGRLQGAARLKRHLWRMSVALFIASASFFLGPVRRIPEPLRIPALRLVPLIALLTMTYWLWRYRGRKEAGPVVRVPPDQPPPWRKTITGMGRRIGAPGRYKSRRRSAPSRDA